jgi:hypothetical protein
LEKLFGMDDYFQVVEVARIGPTGFSCLAACLDLGAAWQEIFAIAL